MQLPTHDSAGEGPLGLAALLARFANEQRLPDHYTPERVMAALLSRFNRRIAADLKVDAPERFERVVDGILAPYELRSRLSGRTWLGWPRWLYKLACAADCWPSLPTASKRIPVKNPVPPHDVSLAESSSGTPRVSTLIDSNTVQSRPVLSVANRLVYRRPVRENDRMKRHDCPQQRIVAIRSYARAE